MEEWDVDRPHRMTANEFGDGPHIYIEGLRILIQDFLGSARIDLLDRHKKLL
jgi:hypothetical protein